MKVAAIQMVSGADLCANLEQASDLIRNAVEQGAEMLVLPENFALMGRKDLLEFALAERHWNGPISNFLSETAKKFSIWLVGGSMPYRIGIHHKEAPLTKVFSTSTVWSPAGKLLTRYDKCHLFDVNVEDGVGVYRESDDFEPGCSEVVACIPQAKLGLSICYDLRFAEYYRLLRDRGAEIITVPAAFTYKTGQAHWEVLLRARAIENQVFVVASNQGGDHGKGRVTWGHTCIINPWGDIMACREEPGPGVVLADIDLGLLKRVRESMPIQNHRYF